MNSLASIEEAYSYCESVTRRHAKSFHFAASFLPKSKQKLVFPIYAFCRHVDDEIDELPEGDEASALRAVSRWQDLLEQVYAGGFKECGRGSSSSITREQSLVFIAWDDLLSKHPIRKEIPLDLIKGVVQDTVQKRYADFDELYVYCYRVASTVGLMSSEILGYSDPSALKFAEAMGIGMQLTNILRDIGEDARRGRIYIPKKDLTKFGLTEDEILSCRMSEAMTEMIKFQIARARDYYRTGEQGIPLLEKDARFTVLLASRVYGAILSEIEKQNFDVFARRAHTTKLQKLLSMPRIYLEAARM